MLTMTEQEFNEKYPNWVVTDPNGKYTNLPKEQFILTSDTVQVGVTWYIAIDNSDYCCWNEDFKTLADAQAYLR